ncbi:MAG: type I glyceraldehyde-3-phosphate dehydrogenase [Patescibacteria group bacterium]|nr:type I glyceraldehyde-3-phosphate dehydrogenase [Patescibacteria group bacterium]
MLKVAINGFGRIGRQAAKVLLENRNVLIVAINDLTEPEMLAYLLKHDSVYGESNLNIKSSDKALVVGSKKIPVFAEKDPLSLPWKSLEVDVVIESTGRFTDREKASSHLVAGSKKVVISAPAKDPDATLVLGVNHKEYNPDKHHIISNGSCTTNCLAPIAKVMNDKFGVKRSFMNTVHAFTNSQNILDLPAKERRAARAATINIIPHTSGATKSVVEAIPELKGKMDGLALRVPVADVSILDYVVQLKKKVEMKNLLAAFEKAAAKEMKGILKINYQPLVSSDFIGDPHSAIVDAPLTMIMDGDLVRVMAWYDNEWGYSNRLAEMTIWVGNGV